MVLVKHQLGSELYNTAQSRDFQALNPNIFSKENLLQNCLLQTVADVGSIFEKYITVTEEYISLVEQTATPDRLTKSPLTQPLPVRSVQKGR